MRPLVSVKKSEKFKSGQGTIPISLQDFNSSYCHVYIIGGAFYSKEQNSCRQRPLQSRAGFKSGPIRAEEAKNN